ncbi:MAG: protein kinase, partial [Fibrobacter sp.]|nr:protein kinase [Fibrobacter sp.]
MSLFQFRSSRQQPTPSETKERYRIIGLLGKGKHTDIFNCFDEELNRIVALKQLRSDFATDRSIVKMFTNEARTLGFLEHPGIVTLYDMFIDETGAPAYTMELVKGNSLRWECRNRTMAQLLNIFIKLCETLAAAHASGVVHLDLNPENIMIGPYGEVVIIDWGSSRIFDDKPYKNYVQFIREAPDPPSYDNYSSFGAISKYNSPEQAAGDIQSLSPSSDIFSMGVILYEMMSGVVPFSGNNPQSLANQIQNCNALPLNEICSDIPKHLSQICDKMMAKDPYDRYHSFNQVLNDLDHFQNSGQTFSKLTLHTGDVLFREGEQGDFAFIINSGTIEVSRIVNGMKVVLACLKRGEICGELALFTNEPRSATITALEETTISLLARESVEGELQKLSPWIQNMIYGLSKRFTKLNDYLV